MLTPVWKWWHSTAMQKNIRISVARFLQLMLLACCVACTCARHNAKSVGILAALPQELDAIVSHMTDTHVMTIGADTFMTGKIGATPVVATLSGMGKVNAAMAAQRLVSNFHAAVLLFSGVAGGINPAFEIGDVVLGLKSFQHDVGFLSESFTLHPPGVLPEIGLGNAQAVVQVGLSANWPAIDGTKNFFASLLEFMKKESTTFQPVVVNGQSYVPVVRAGMVATGDQFIAHNAKKTELKQLGADVVEMEGDAVAQVARKNSVPCLIIRSISDKAGTHATLDFGNFFATVAKNNAHVVVGMLMDAQYSAYFKRLLH